MFLFLYFLPSSFFHLFLLNFLPSLGCLLAYLLVCLLACFLPLSLPSSPFFLPPFPHFLLLSLLSFLKTLEKISVPYISENNNIWHNYLFQCTQSELDVDLVKSILSEYRINNADVTLRYDATADDLIDVIEGNRYMKCFYYILWIHKSFTFVVFSL